MKNQILLFFLIVAVLFIVFLVLISMYVYGKIKESKILSSLNEMIETYRKNDLEMEAALSKAAASQIGAYRLIYTRNAEGRKILLHARAKAFANRNERVFNRKKKVKGALE